MWRPLGCRLDARWQEVWPHRETKSRERYGSRTSSLHLFSRPDDSAVACYSGIWQTVLPVVACSETS